MSAPPFHPTMCPDCGAPLEIEVDLSSVMLQSSDWAWVGLMPHGAGFVPVIDTEMVSEHAFQDGVNVDVACTDEDCGWAIRVGADGWEHGTRPDPETPPTDASGPAQEASDG